MPPKRTSNKRKTVEIPSDALGPSKRARHKEGNDDKPGASAKWLCSQDTSEHSQIQHKLSNDAPISSGTRSGVRKRTSTDANLQTSTQKTSRPAKRKRIIGPANTEHGGDVISNEKALLLPIELHSLILDLFWEPWADDLRREILPTILACTSVCRLWRAAALPHLFRSVKVTGSNGLRKLASVIHGDPSVTSYIRKIRLFGDWARDRGQDRWIYAFPSVFKTSLPSLRTLDLRSLDLNQSQKNDIRVYVDWIHTLSSLASVSQLNLGGISMSPNALTSLVCAFPGLIKVWAEGLDIEETNNLAPLTRELNRAKGRRMTTRSLVDNRGTLSYPMLHSPSSIRHVRVDSHDYGLRFPLVLVKDWLYPNGISPNLLVLDLMPGLEERSMAKLITTASPFLEVLHIPTQGTEISKFKRTRLDLSKLCRLKTLRIYTWHEDYIELDTVYYFLMLLDAPRLETLWLAIGYEEKESAGLQAIDRCLATTKFKHLKEFVIDILWDNREPFDYRRRFIEAQFPLTRGRGILKVRDNEFEKLPFKELY